MTPRRTLTPADRTLLDALVRELAPRLLAYAYRVLGSSDAAEDVVAETVCRAAENIVTLRSADRPDLYLVTVARNLCRDRWRRKQPESWSDEQLVERPGNWTEPQRELEKGEHLAALRAAVDSLPASLREIVVLRTSVGLSFEEIAGLLQIPLGTALSRMHSATQKLRSLLETEDAKTG